ncbi:hypothetical protein [Microcoleus sp. D3_18a_C4]
MPACSEKGFAILIKSWKITWGEWEAIALLELKGDRSDSKLV